MVSCLGLAELIHEFLEGNPSKEFDLVLAHSDEELLDFIVTGFRTKVPHPRVSVAVNMPAT